MLFIDIGYNIVVEIIEFYIVVIKNIFFLYWLIFKSVNNFDLYYGVFYLKEFFF